MGKRGSTLKKMFNSHSFLKIPVKSPSTGIMVMIERSAIPLKNFLSCFNHKLESAISSPYIHETDESGKTVLVFWSEAKGGRSRRKASV